MALYETTSKGGYIYDFIYVFAGIRNSADGAHNYNWGPRYHCIQRYHHVRIDDCMDHKDCKEEEVKKSRTSETWCPILFVSRKTHAVL